MLSSSEIVVFQETTDERRKMRIGIGIGMRYLRALGRKSVFMFGGTYRWNGTVSKRVVDDARDPPCSPRPSHVRLDSTGRDT